MIKKLLLALALFNVFIMQSNADHLEKTNAMHNEVTEHKNYNISVETHPILYKMVEELVIKANVAMPRYITIYGAEYQVVSKNGVVRSRENDIGAYIDYLGDLHICYEVLENATYDEIKGVIAIAIAEKSINKPKTIALTGFTTFTATLVLIYLLNKKYKLELGSNIIELFNNKAHHEKENFIESIIFFLIAPSLITAKLASNYLQKTIDLKAAKLVNAQDIIDSLKKIFKIKESYFKENVLSRIASALKIKTIFNTLFYPIRAFTFEERINYLEKEVASAS